MHITRARRIVQGFFLGLFVFLALVTSFQYLQGYPASLLLQLDPLVAIGSALGTGSLYQGLIWSLAIVVLTILVGRAFCGWICPFGTIHHVVGWLVGARRAERRIDGNRYRPINGLKYLLLAGMLTAAIAGSLQAGLLDPIALLARSLTTTVWPLLTWSSVRPPVFHLAWVIAAIFLVLVGIDGVAPRFFCRALCPLGATLGVLSRFSLWRIDRDPEKCTDCDLCLRGCEGAADPQADLRKAECYACMNCLDDCPYGALSFACAPSARGEIAQPNVGRRQVVFASLIGFVFAPIARLSGAPTGRADAAVIRPPGSRAEPEFLTRCCKCDQCLRICPTNVLQPALFEAGIEGLWSPVLINRAGYCELNCVLCGEVCPTGAIRRISIEEKVGAGRYAGRPISIGTAFIDRGRCLPWAMDTPCVVCEEVCPTSPKAIRVKHVDSVNAQGATVALRVPYVDPARCIGCGICENKCPVKDVAGVRVTPIGETRAADRLLLTT